MSSLILPSRFTSQPQGEVEVDWRNPLSRGLKFDLNTISLQNRVTSELNTNVGTSVVATINGLARRLTRASSQYINCGDVPWLDVGGGNFSIELVFRLNSAASGMTRMQLFSKDSSTGRQLWVELNSGEGGVSQNSISLVWANGALHLKHTPADSLQVGVLHHVVLQRTGASTTEILIDGVNQSLTNQGSGYPDVLATTTGLYLGRRAYSGYEENFDGDILVARFRDRSLSSDEVAALSKNPWQLFRAKPRVLYFTTAGGGASASLSITTDGSTVSSSAYVSPVASLSVSTSDSVFSGSAIVSPLASLAITTADAVPSASAYVSPVASLAITTESATFGGSAAVGNGASLNITTDSAVFAGSASVSPVAAFTVSTDDSIFNGSAGTITGAALNVSTAAAVFSGSAYVSPIAGFAITTELAAFAGSASVTVPVGTGTLDPATIAAIADAVWAHSSAVDFSAKMLICSRILRNRMVTDPVTGIMTIYDDDDVTPYLTAQLYENVAETQTYRGQGAEVRARLT